MHHPYISFPKGYAMKIKKGTRLQLLLMVHNPTPPTGPGGVYRDVYARTTLHKDTDVSRATHPVQFRYLFLDDEQCGHSEGDFSDINTFPVPPHAIHYVFSGSLTTNPASAYTFTKPTTIVYMGGHVHGWQGGKAVILKKNGTQFARLSSAPSVTVPYQYDTEHYATSTTFKAGDTISIDALYDNPHAVESRGAMGMLGMYYSQE
jgi:hypothetical protein